MTRRAPKILNFLRRAEDEVVALMEDENERKDAEKQEISQRLKALESKVGVMERGSR